MVKHLDFVPLELRNVIYNGKAPEFRAIKSED